MSVPKAQPVTAPAGTPNPWPAYRLADARRDRKKAGRGWATGFRQFAAINLKWSPGELYVVAGRPGHGKTAFMLEALMRHVEERVRVGCDKAPAVFLSFEENLYKIHARILKRQVRALADARNAQAPSGKWMNYWLDEEPMPRETPELTPEQEAGFAKLCQDAADQLDTYMGRHLTLFDGDLFGNNINDLLDGLRETATRSGTVPSFVVVDYFQKVRPPQDAIQSGTRQLQLQAVARELLRYAKGLKADAKESTPELSVPVLLGAQVGRRENEQKAPPELEDIREADDLSHEANAILTLRRGENDGRAKVVELKIAVPKNRDGSTRDTVNPLPFLLEGEYSRVLEGESQQEASGADDLKKFEEMQERNRQRTKGKGKR